jgi:serine/threonine protein kinase
MPLSRGNMLGPYEILAPLSAGGMGEVYKARDTRRDRIVAVKSSKIQFSARFEQEARSVAALNHPNICTLYDVGPNYLVMAHKRQQAETLHLWAAAKKLGMDGRVTGSWPNLRDCARAVA